MIMSEKYAKSHLQPYTKQLALESDLQAYTSVQELLPRYHSVWAMQLNFE